MKKLLLITLVISLVACSSENDLDSTISNSTIKVKSFKSNPTPEDYLNMQYPKYMESVAFFKAEKSSSTKKIDAVWVNTYVPDLNFRTKLISIGAGREDAVIGDQYIDIDRNLQILDVSNSGISDVTGLTGFKSLAQLKINNNNLTKLAVSRMQTLRLLECQNNKIEFLNLGSLYLLEQLWCQNNMIDSIFFPENSTNLWGVWCYNNRLTSLELHTNTGVTDLFIQENKLTSLNTTQVINLKQINVSNNNWVTLNFNSNNTLISLWCTNNVLLSDLYIKSPNANNIINQDFTQNKYGLKVHVHENFLANAISIWPNYGNSIYVL
ncbi:leucine-rich repeat domain-containing protein [Flavobacterium geliluteum]|uniref:Internalin n=1 Tax=Flavobacterium geliluteum TaxID=2816120 RepID=A0A940XDN2_9FLAO|nr:hypothetical protein [Flavobacterium geliluteum]MBP4137870.1 hypothetical protein [Flavobacterium geliluteum]